MKVQNPLKLRRSSIASTKEVRASKNVDELTNSSTHTSRTDPLSSSFKDLSLSGSSHHQSSYTSTSSSTLVSFAQEESLCEFHPSSYELSMQLEETLWYDKADLDMMLSEYLNRTVKKCMAHEPKHSLVTAIEQWNKTVQQMVKDKSSSSSTDNLPAISALTQEYQDNEYYQIIGVEYKILKRLQHASSSSSQPQQKPQQPVGGFAKLLGKNKNKHNDSSSSSSTSTRRQVLNVIQQHYNDKKNKSKNADHLAEQCRALTAPSRLFAQGIAQAVANASV